MSELKYKLHEGVYQFNTEFGVDLLLKNVEGDKYGRIHADARFITSEGAVLGLAHGDLTSGQWRRELGAQVAARNSGDPIRWENALIEAVIALESHPTVSSQVPPLAMPQLISVREYAATVPPPRTELVEGLYDLGTLQAVVAKPKVANRY